MQGNKNSLKVTAELKEYHKNTDGEIRLGGDRFRGYTMKIDLKHDHSF